MSEVKMTSQLPKSRILELLAVGRYADVIAIYKTLLAKEQSRAQPDPALLLFVYEQLSTAYYRLGDYFSCITQRNLALALLDLQDKRNARRVVRLRYLIGRCLLWTARTAEAEEHLRESLAFVRSLPDHEQQEIGFVLIDLAQLHAWQGELDEAEWLLREALRQNARHFGTSNSHFAMTLYHIGRLYFLRKQFSTSLRPISKCLSIFERHQELENFEYTAALSQRGLVYVKLGQFSEARADQMRTLELLQRFLQPDQLEIARVKRRLAHLDSLEQTAK